MAEAVELKAVSNEPKKTGGPELKEYDKLDALLSQIPKKAQHGILKSCDLILTCIDANKSHIALGTNVGLTFLYSRSDHSIQRLKSGNNSDVITCVRLHHGIDDLLATGTASGDISVYCMPGVISVQKKQLQKFDVKDVHKHYITCLEWSTNGMKVYSGDKNGYVVTTEVDFYAGQCQSSILLVEPSTEITQLDYRHKVILVSTRQRSFIIRLDQQCQLTPIGTQDRKMPGPFGACFVPGLCKTDDAKLYAARPGCRLWLADMDGVVRSTHIFSDPLSPAVPEIPLLSAGKLQLSQSDFQFGNLKWFRETEIVTWSSTALVVLNPEGNKVVARQGRLSGIIDAAVVEDTGEIFLLRRHGEARVIRISDKSEPKTNRVEVMPMLPLLPAAEKTDKVAVKEQQAEVKESPAGLFFKKLAGPLKKLENTILHDSSHAMKSPDAETAKAATDMSPELPPVVQLASPDLDGVRVFTGNSPAPAAAAAEGAPATSSPSDALDQTGSDPNANSASSPAIPLIKTEHTDADQDQPSHDAHHFLGESSIPPSDNTEDGGIVFSHKMKKHKKKKQKSGALRVRGKDEDSISQLSAGSQFSDDLNVTATPNNTPANFDSPLDTIKRADDMLKYVESILKGNDNKAQQPSPLIIQSSENLEQEQNTLTFPSDEAEKEMPTVGTSMENVSSVTSVISNDSKVIQTSPSRASEKTDQLAADANVSALIGKETDEKIVRTVRTSSLSESDQHLDLTAVHQVEVSPKVNDTPKPTRDYADILESAMANLAKSKALEEETSTPQMIVPPRMEASKPKAKVKTQDSFQDIYSEIEAIESTDPFKKGYKKENPADDFYSNFLDTSPESPTSPTTQPIRAGAPIVSRPSEEESCLAMGDITERRLANSWSEFSAPANIYSLALSDTHVWFTDKSENIHYSSIGNPKGILWRKATGHANQISVSPSGHIVWRLHKGVVFAGTKINSRHPEGLKWVEAVRDVETICVDNACAWYIKRNGDVMMQRGLSLERPCYKSKKVECPHKVKYIVCRYGIVWAVTESLRLMARGGICNDVPEGTDWVMNDRETPPYLFSHVSIDNEKIGWAIDVLGQIWFCDDVTREQPQGKGHWWQVPLSEYVLQDETTMDMIKAVARKFDPKKLSHILSTNRGGLITAGSQGVWLALDFRNVVQVCRGSVQGYHWLEAHPAQMASSSCWKLVCAGISHLDWGLIWAQHTNGDVYTFKRARAEATMVSDNCNFCCIATSPFAVWALTTDGVIRVRTGMGAHCPQGSGWVDLDLSQLGDAHIVHLSCNSMYVWAVESEGVIYQRIGAKPPSENNLSPVWLPIDTFADIVFTQVHTGPLDWMVWAIDNRRLTYVRAGITESMPIGQEWVHVPGIQAVDLALTRTGVWALTPNGEVFFRYGIARDRPCGNYWKKIPGTYIKLSASPNDELWGINTEGQLMQCSVKYLMRQRDADDPLLQRTISTSSSVSEDVDWEIV